MRLTLVISSLAAGGAERVISELANYWVANNWTVTLLVFTDDKAEVFYSLNPKVKLVFLDISWVSKNFKNGMLNNCKRIIKLRRAIKNSNPKVILSFMDTTNVLVLISCLGLAIPVVVAERSNPKKKKIGMMWNFLRTFFYSYASRIVVLTPRVKNFFPKKLQEKVVSISNWVSLSRLNGNEDGNQLLLPKPFVVAMGRFTREKGMDLLIQAFQLLHSEYPEWRLVIIGDGEMRLELQDFCNQVGLQDKVIFLGLLTNPFPILKQAELFVLPSRHEGFPNALCEAIACGLPVVSFDCEEGPAYIVRHNIDGLLVPPEDVNELALAMSGLMSDKARRMAMASHVDEFLDRFESSKIIGKWDVLLTGVVNEYKR
jgi:GalNAc-alpha-(1->4)-GalNAc-alpha-(1->3)-diNAcBac-PP-undecaprenol alpha-1,4-N-acetyl-D-galactosaminyltransferase